MAHLLLELSDAYAEIARYQESTTLARDAVEIWAGLPANDEAYGELIVARMALARGLRELGLNADATAVYLQAAHDLHRQFGNDELFVLAFRSETAEYLMEVGEVDAARKLCLAQLRDLEEAYGIQDYRVLATMILLGRAHARAGDDTQAVAVLEAAMSRMASQRTTSLRAEALAELSKVWEARGDASRAEATLSEWYRLLRESRGESVTEASAVAACAARYAQLLTARGDVTTAAEVLEWARATTSPTTPR